MTLLTPGHLSRGVEDGAGGALPRWALGTSEHGLGASHLKAGKLEPWLSAPSLVGWGCFWALTLWRSQQSGGRQSDRRSQEAPSVCPGGREGGLAGESHLLG